MIADSLPTLLADFEDWGELLVPLVIFIIYAIGGLGRLLTGAGKKDAKRPGGKPRPQRSFTEDQEQRRRIEQVRPAHQRPPQTAGAGPRAQQPEPRSLRDRAEQQRQRVAQRIRQQQEQFERKEAQVRMEAAGQTQAHLQQWQRQIERQKALAAQKLREKQQAEQTARRQQQAAAARRAPSPAPSAPVGPAVRSGDLLAQLQDRDTLRSAFVLTEILGPPVSLRE